MATRNPSAASLRAAPAPMPLPPAVTIATFSDAMAHSRGVVCGAALIIVRKRAALCGAKARSSLSK